MRPVQIRPYLCSGGTASQYLPVDIAPQALYRSFCLVLFTAVFLTGGHAQTPGCVPNGPNYPCVYVANENSSSVSVINSATNQVITTVANVPFPQAVAIAPDNATVYVAGSQQISVIDTATNTLSTTNFTLQSPPAGIAVTPDGTQLWVTEPLDDSTFIGIEIINITGTSPGFGTPITGLSSPTAVAFGPSGTTAYVADTCTPNPAVPSITVACMDVINVSSHAVTQISFANTLSDQPASIAVAPDGQLACMTLLDGNMNLQIGCIRTADNSEVTPPASSSTPAVPSEYGLAVTPAGVLYAAAPGLGESFLDQIYLFNPSANSYIGATTVGTGPTGVAISADGTSAYITNCCGRTGTVSVLNIGTGAIATTIAVGVRAQGIAAMPSVPPSITTQPASQTVDYGQTATLSVAATGTAPLTYQWYQGQSGDTTTPVAGATASSFTTPALTTSTSYWVQVSNIVAGGAINSSTAAVTVNILTPPVITTQPAAVAITVGQSATLTVSATGTPPLTYQWYQGATGDTSTPVAGATAASVAVTPSATTSYWVQVANSAGTANSAAAVVTVNHLPTCSLVVQGTQTSDFVTKFTIQAIAVCSDPQNSALTTTITWGDGSAPATGPGGSLTATHTYTPPLDSNYISVVSATDTLGLTGSASYSNILVPASSVPGVFSGQSSDFNLNLPAVSPPVQVTFECTTATESDGSVVDASSIGISCNTTPAIVTLGAAQTIQVGIHTTGFAVGSTRPASAIPGWFYACCMPWPGMLMWPGRRRKAGLFVLLLMLSSALGGCGGGFVIPSKTPGSTSTPPTSYQLTIVDAPVNPANATGFVQISLIVPLTVSQTQ